MDNDFRPSPRLSANGSPTGRTYWGLPVTTISKADLASSSTVDAICKILDSNAKLLDDALTQYARERVFNPDGTSTIAHCCAQAIQTIRDVRDVVSALSSAGG